MTTPSTTTRHDRFVRQVECLSSDDVHALGLAANTLAALFASSFPGYLLRARHQATTAIDDYLAIPGQAIRGVEAAAFRRRVSDAIALVATQHTVSVHAGIAIHDASLAILADGLIPETARALLLGVWTTVMDDPREIQP